MRSVLADQTNPFIRSGSGVFDPTSACWGTCGGPTHQLPLTTLRGQMLPMGSAPSTPASEGYSEPSRDTRDSNVVPE